MKKQRARRPEAVLGHDLRAPRLTGYGWAIVALWVLPPVTVLIVGSDLLGWWVARALWGVCFGLVCLL